MSKAVVKTLQELVQTFFCQRLQLQQRVSGHTVASYRDTFRLAFEFIQKKTGRAANQQSLTDWEAQLFLLFWITWKRSVAVNRAPAMRGWQPSALLCVTSANRNRRLWR